MSALSRTQHTRKHVIETAGGVVASQHRQAAEAGAAVLRAGGDAVDAAVATSFVVGVLEPWMSGPAGGGAAIHWRADTGEAVAINFGMRSPKGLNINDYPLSGDGKAGDLFPWERVVEDRNVEGATAIAVPGTVDGLGQAHARWGRMPWAELLEPAVSHAREGMLVDWYAALLIASTARNLAKDPDAAAMFLDDGTWPKGSGWTAIPDNRLDQSRVAASLAHMAEAGPRSFYEGDLAQAMAQDVQDKGGCLAAEDLAGYSAWMGAARPVDYRDARFHVMPGLTAGPTFARVMEQLETADLSTPAATYVAYARALDQAYAERLGKMGDDGEVPEAPGCTTHFSVVDRDGNMVTHTQTLLSIFGSRVVSPSTGFLMNNGIMWFDPEQGRPNSLAPNKACLMNVCPVLGERGDTRFAFGASGGRKIVSAVSQLASFVVDGEMDVEQAFHTPRIDMSGGAQIIADETLPTEVISALSDEKPTQTTRRTVSPYAFACPAGVMRKDGANSGCTEIMSPWGDAISEDDL